MLTVPHLLNRYIAPFFMGVCMAATAAASGAVSAVILLCLAGLAGYFSLPGGEQRAARLFDSAI